MVLQPQQQVGPSGSLINAFVRSGIYEPIASAAYLFGYPEAASRWQQRWDVRFPAHGASAFVGGVAGGISRSAAGVLQPWLWPAVIGSYVAESAGVARGAVYRYEQGTGKDVPYWQEMAVATGAGAATLLAEAAGAVGFEHILKRTAPKVFYGAVDQVARGNFRLASKAIAHNAVGSSLVEASEESVEQVLNNALEQTYNKDRRLFEGIIPAAVGGALGGGMLAGVMLRRQMRELGEAAKGERRKVEALEPDEFEKAAKALVAANQDLVGSLRKAGGFGETELLSVVRDMLGSGMAADAVRTELDAYAAQEELMRTKIAPRYAVSTKQASVKEFMAAVENTLIPKLSISDDEVQRRAGRLLKKDPTRTIVGIYAKVEKGEGLNEPEMSILTSTYDMVAHLATKQFQEASTNEEANAVLDKYLPLGSVGRIGISRAGRTLRQVRTDVREGALLKVREKLGRSFTEAERQIVASLDWTDPKAVEAWTKSLDKPTWTDYLRDLYLSNLVGNPSTTGVNLFGSLAWAMYQIPHRAFVAGVDLASAIATGRTQQYYLRSIMPAMYGFVRGLPAATSRAIKALRPSGQLEQDTKYLYELHHSLWPAAERTASPKWRNFWRAMTYGMRGLAAGDVFVRQLAYSASLYRMTSDQALSEGLRGKAYEKRRQELLEKKPQKLLDKATQEALYSAFMDHPLKIARWFIEGRYLLPGHMGIFAVPFVNTLVNIVKRGTEMIPIVGAIYQAPALARTAKGIAEPMKPGTEMTNVIAKQLEGAILSFALLALIGDEDRLTGPYEGGPKAEAMKRKGIPFNAIKFGDTWFAYDRIEPFSTTLNALAIVREAIKEADSEAEATQIFASAAGHVVRALVESGFTENVGRWMSEKGAINGLKRLPATFVPYYSMFRSVARAVEASHGTAVLHEADGALARIANIIPYVSEELPPRLTVWGEPIEIPGGVLRQWLPFKWSEEKGDRTEEVLKNLNMYPGLPSQDFTIRGITFSMPDEIYRDYCLLFGKQAKQFLDKITSREGFALLPEDRQKRLLDSNLRRVRALMRKRALVELRRRLREEERNAKKAT